METCWPRPAPQGADKTTMTFSFLSTQKCPKNDERLFFNDMFCFWLLAAMFLSTLKGDNQHNVFGDTLVAILPKCFQHVVHHVFSRQLERLIYLKLQSDQIGPHEFWCKNISKRRRSVALYSGFKSGDKPSLTQKLSQGSSGCLAPIASHLQPLVSCKVDTRTASSTLLGARMLGVMGHSWWGSPKQGSWRSFGWKWPELTIFGNGTHGQRAATDVETWRWLPGLSLARQIREILERGFMICWVQND